MASPLLIRTARLGRSFCVLFKTNDMVEIENHKRFKKHLKNSSDAVFTIAHHLHKRDFDVLIPATKVAERHSDWKEYADNYDILAYKNDSEYRIEVKGLGFDFTDEQDWPHKEFIVCTKHAYDMKPVKPAAFYRLNKDRTHAAVIPTSTFDSWYTKPVKDSRYIDYLQDCYFCPFNCIKWIKL